MTINSTTNRVQYSGNGSTTAFAFGYKFTANSSLVVTLTDTTTLVDTVQTLNTHYTVTGAGNDAGGTVTFLSAPASGKRVTIERSESYTQGTDYTEASSFPAESHEDALDKLTMLTQQLSDAANRAVKRKSTSASTIDLSLPEPVALKAIGFNKDGDGLDTLDGFYEPNNVAITGGDIEGVTLSNIQSIEMGGTNIVGTSRYYFGDEVDGRYLGINDFILDETNIQNVGTLYVGGLEGVGTGLFRASSSPGDGGAIGFGTTDGDAYDLLLGDDVTITSQGADLINKSTYFDVVKLLQSPYILTQSATPVSNTATTSEETLATITLPANYMGANGSVLISASFTYTNSANNKIMRIKFGGTTYKAVTNTTSATQQIEVVVYNRNATNSQVGDQSQTITNPFDPSTNPLITSAVDTTSAVTILITGQKASSGETLTLENYQVIVNYRG